MAVDAKEIVAPVVPEVGTVAVQPMVHPEMIVMVPVLVQLASPWVTVRVQPREPALA